VNAKKIITDPSSPVPADTVAILESVIEERDRAMAKWGVQNHPDGTLDFQVGRNQRDRQRARVDQKHEEGTSNWYDILLEEVYEVMCEEDLVALDKELNQVMQVCLVWREDLRRRMNAAHDERVASALEVSRNESKEIAAAKASSALEGDRF
jgi:hypothetical protein